MSKPSMLEDWKPISEVGDGLWPIYGIFFYGIGFNYHIGQIQHNHNSITYMYYLIMITAV